MKKVRAGLTMELLFQAMMFTYWELKQQSGMKVEMTVLFYKADRISLPGYFIPDYENE